MRWAHGALALAMLVSACGNDASSGDDARADPNDSARIARGAVIYARDCAACHGARLEGQSNWRARLPNGRMPAPPHDESGHTWHHADGVLFAITKNGLVPPHAPRGYASDMPGFGSTLTDEEIWSVLAYIKSHWTSPEVLAARREMTANVPRR